MINSIHTNKEKYFIVATFAILLGIYLYFKCDNIGFGDDLGFLTAITLGFDPGTNATTHFLYINLLSAFANFTPGFTLFDKAVIFSIVFSIATLIQLFRTVKLVTHNVFSSLAATVMLGLSFTYWRQTEIIEVYTFNNFLFASMLYLIIKDYINQSGKNTLWVSTLLGLALIGHIQNILLVPFYLTYLYFVVKSDYKKIALNILVVGVIFSVLIIIPLIWKTNSILSIFFENDNFQNKATAIELSGLLKGLLKGIGYFIYNFLFFAFFILHGLYLLWKNDMKLSLLLALAFLPFAAFAIRYDVPDSYVFYLQSYVVLAIISGYSYEYWRNKYQKLKWLAPVQIISFMLIYFLVWQVALKVPQLSSLDKKKEYKGGLKYLVWPGMKDNASLLKLSKEIYLNGKKPESFEEFEWNYNKAVKYLKLIGELK